MKSFRIHLTSFGFRDELVLGPGFAIVTAGLGVELVHGNVGRRNWAQCGGRLGGDELVQLVCGKGGALVPEYQGGEFVHGHGIILVLRVRVYVCEIWLQQVVHGQVR
jgi:hypothetical protein